METTWGSPSKMCSLLNLFRALITPGPIASPHDLSLGKIDLSTKPTTKSGFKFLYYIAAFAPAGPAPIIKTSYFLTFFCIF